MKYRILKNGEQIKLGDQWKTDSGDWFECDTTIGDKIGGPGIFAPRRRPLKSRKPRNGKGANLGTTNNRSDEIAVQLETALSYARSGLQRDIGMVKNILTGCIAQLRAVR